MSGIGDVLLEIELFGDRVLIRRDKVVDQEVKHGSILLPNRVQEPPRTGVVVAVGVDVSELSIGDRVMHERTGEIISLGGEDLLLLRENNFIMKLPDENSVPR